MKQLQFNFCVFFAKLYQSRDFDFWRKQDAHLSQRDRAAGCVSFGQKWKTGTERQYFTDIIGLSSTTVT